MGEILACLVLVVFGLPYLIITQIGEWLSVPPEDKLLNLQPPFAWGGSPQPVACSECDKLNEFDAEVCFRCGALIMVETVDEVLIKSVAIPGNTFRAKAQKLVLKMHFWLTQKNIKNF